MIDVQGVIQRGKRRLVSKYPQLMFDASQITDEVADALGAPKSELQDKALMDSIAQYAAAIGRDLFELLVESGSDSEEEANKIKAQRAKEVDEHLGL